MDISIPKESGNRMALTARTLSGLVLFRGLLSRSPLAELRALLATPTDDLDALTERYAELSLAILSDGGDLTKTLLLQVCESENLYTEHLRTGRGDRALLEPLLARELLILSEAADYDGWQLRLTLGDASLPTWNHSRVDFYASYLAHIEKGLSHFDETKKPVEN